MDNRARASGSEGAMVIRAANIFDELLLRGHDEDYEPAALPVPTAARPGSLEKLLVLCDRASQGLALFHPRDEKILATVEEVAEAKAYVAQVHAILNCLGGRPGRPPGGFAGPWK